MNRKSLIHGCGTGQQRATEPPAPGGCGASVVDVRQAGGCWTAAGSVHSAHQA